MPQVFTVKLKRTSAKDEYGGSRQDNILMLEEGQQLGGIPDYREKDYERIILIHDSTGGDLGEIDGTQAEDITNAIDRGNIVLYSAEKITGREEYGKRLSLTVKVEIYTSKEAREKWPEEYAKLYGLGEPVTQKFHTKLKGVTYENEDGRSRQEIIANDLKPGIELSIVREPENPHDSNTIAVRTLSNGDRVGFLSADLASRFAPLMDSGQLITAVVKDITGSEQGNLGVNILLTVFTKQESEKRQRSAAKYQAVSPAKPEKPAEPTVRSTAPTMPARTTTYQTTSPARPAKPAGPIVRSTPIEPAKYQAVSPSKPDDGFVSVPSSTPRAVPSWSPDHEDKKKKKRPGLLAWWRGLSKRTRTWIIVIAILILLYLCKALAN
ncbi:MAG: HIRAN domain-containing protein [Anaerolineaceae bacterium]|jgi:hypothetical protein